MTDEKLGADLKAAPGVGWWRRLRRSSTSSSSGDPIDPTMPASDMQLPARRMSTAHSSRSARSNVSKDSISYPLQVPLPLNTSANTAARPDNRHPSDKPLSCSRHHPPPPAAHSSAASFELKRPTAQLVAVVPSQALARRHFEADGAGYPTPTMLRKLQKTDFQRLFGCSPATSPTTPTFPRRQSSSREAANEERFRETLDLRPAQDWIGSRVQAPQLAL